jgi:amino acid adenylation domain-containing protein
VLLLSARTSSALDKATVNLAQHLQHHPNLNLADVAYTTQVGRQPFTQRRAVLCRDQAAAVAAMQSLDAQQVFQGQAISDRPVAFMFTGQGAQYVRMAAGLYDSEPLFRAALDDCADALAPHLGLDLRDLLFPPDDAGADLLEQTQYTQPALFVIEYALAKLWMSWGVKPEAMIGHSIGEYVAACLAGVFSLEDALALVAARGRMMQAAPAGSMLSVALSEDELSRLLETGAPGMSLQVAAVNGPSLCVVSGPDAAVEALEQRLAERGVHCRRLHTSHAFHSALMDSVLAPFTALVEQIDLNPPQLPYVSNLSGTWVTPEEATDPAYWSKHLRETVRFGDGLATLMQEPSLVLLEVGPGRTLATFARRHPDCAPDRIVLTSLRHPQDQQDDLAFLLAALGRLWTVGVAIDWSAYGANEYRRRMPLPTYPFERQRYWIDAATTAPVLLAAPADPSASETVKRSGLADWLYLPSWRRADWPALRNDGVKDVPARVLLFADANGLGELLAQRLTQHGSAVTVVHAGGGFDWLDNGAYVLNPNEQGDFDRLIADLKDRDNLPEAIVHLWSITPDAGDFETAQKLGWISLVWLVQALAREAGRTAGNGAPDAHPFALTVVTAGVQEVIGTETLFPEQATILGACQVIPQEYPHVVCRSVDVVAPEPGSVQAARLAGQLLAELAAPRSRTPDTIVAYRGGHRWTRTFEPLAPEALEGAAPRLRERGVYLITGGLGRIGLTLAAHLAQSVQARLVLVGRSALPPRETWAQWLANHAESDPASQRIRKVLALEAHGAEVLALAADVADQAQIAAVIAAAEAQFGELNGVLHAAGFVGPESLRAVQELTQRDYAQQMQAKAYGALALAQALGERELDFCMLQSSLSSVLGGLGMAAYAAANAFLDAFALHQRQTSLAPWLSINWDGWDFEAAPLGGGMNGKEPINLQPARFNAQFLITPEEGAAVFTRLLALAATPQVIVSTGDLEARMRHWAERSIATEEAPVRQNGALHPRPALGNAYVAPRNDLERSLAMLWQEMLGIAEIGVHDNFFELGGHSLMATQLISRLRDAYRVELPLRNLFETPTLAGLAALIAASRETSSTPAATPIRPLPRDGALPLSFGQQRLWFLDQLEPGSPLYNNPAAVHLRGRIEPQTLERCLNDIVRRHEVLRTTFAADDGQPRLVIAAPDSDAARIAINVVDLRVLPQNDRDAEVLRLALSDAQQPFDLARGPLLRLNLLRLAADEHVALLTMHHIVSDGWSVMVLLQELVALYAAYAAGEASPLPALAVQYADVAAWQQQWIECADAHAAGAKPPRQQQLEYWQQQLGGEVTTLELPADRPRPALQSFRGATHWFALPRPLYRALEALAQREGVTLFMTLLAAFQTLLARYSGQEDLWVGTPVAGRNRVEAESLIGFFVNTLVMRTDLSGNPTFREVLGRVREMAIDAFAHQDVPFEMVVDALQPERDLSRTPLFQAMFVLQDAPLTGLEGQGLQVTPLEIDSGTAKFDLTLYLEQDDAELRGWFNYNTDQFDTATIERMHMHWLTLLEGIVADATQPIAGLPLLSEAERRQLLVEWNETATDAAPAPCVHHLIEAQAAQRPNAVAVVCEGQELTYGELNRRANQLARYLQRRGVGPEQLVGICLERSLDSIVALLAIFKAGGAYLPLDPAYPAERLAFMIADAQPIVLITFAGLQVSRLAGWDAQTCEPVNLPTCNLDTDWPAIAQEPASDPERSADRANLAYVIYTSGSTGKPKGVMIEHGAFADHCRDILRSYELTPDDGVLQFASLNFDASLEQIIPTLMAGAKLVLRGPELWNPADFHHQVAAHDLTVINPPTAYWHQLTQEWAAAPERVPVDRLRLVIAGGDAMRPESVELWRQLPVRTARLLNAYGPTETTITATIYEVPLATDDAPMLRALPIGRPLANRVAYVLDRHGNPAPVGVPGELYLGGLGVARGYLNRPELTAEKFIPNPFGAGRLYRTGDLVRYRPDGCIEFLGRVDNQVQVRGFRVELGEVEAVLDYHPAVRESIVLAREDVTGHMQLAAYVLPHSVTGADAPPDAAALRVFLAERLPDYMIPASFVVVDEWPMTPSGKVDRKALPAPELTQAERAKTYVAPRDPVEEDLARIWAEVLGVERVGVYDNFFDLGGHSLLATRLVSQLRENFAVDLPLRRLFETPTVAGLALLIAQSQAEQVEDTDLDQLLAELDQLSDDEAKELLSGSA